MNIIVINPTTGAEMVINRPVSCRMHVSSALCAHAFEIAVFIGGYGVLRQAEFKAGNVSGHINIRTFDGSIEIAYIS
jgi:hypothetical protein